MKIKVICNGFGMMEDPRWIKAFDKVKEKYTQEQIKFECWRTDENLIDLIEKKHREIKWLKDQIEKNNIDKEQKNKFKLKLEKLTENRFMKFESWLYFRIEEVDITRKWYFDDYDGAVSVYYLKKVDNDLNMYAIDFNHYN